MKQEIEQLLSDIDQLTLNKDNQNHELSKILARILDIFDCDRAWCLHPCDPEAEFWGVPVEVTRPEWRGLYEVGMEMPMLESETDVFSQHLNAEGPITYGKDADYPMLEHAENIFMIKSQISTVVYPEQGEAWILGIHYCATRHSFSEDERASFDILGKKLGKVFDNLVLTQLYK